MRPRGSPPRVMSKKTVGFSEGAVVRVVIFWGVGGGEGVSGLGFFWKEGDGDRAQMTEFLIRCCFGRWRCRVNEVWI